MKRKFIIDTDTASDDAVAILMALRHPDIDVLAVTVVSGNMHVRDGSRNARYTVELCGAQTPVYVGCDRPLLREPVHAYWYHGPDGMGGMNYAEPGLQAQKARAVDALVELARAHANEVTLVTLGPLTNIAAALARAPEMAEQISRCVVMGGAANVVGNVTPAAEYNIWCDPEAARIVFRSGMNLEMVGWEVGRGDAALTDADIAAVYALNTPYAEFAMDCNAHAVELAKHWQGDPGMTLHDPTAMAIAIDPGISKRSGHYRVDVELRGELTRGMTVVDERHTVGTQAGFTDEWGVRERNALVHHALDAPRWKELLMECLK
ncbi:MAG: nucleoside hydrolase [Anaerolineae bacterium]|nr:nucleoside hydrolase [Anaerolineae bacterium]